MKYDCLYFWIDGTYGVWRRVTLEPTSPIALADMAKSLEEAGYIVKYGECSVGPPQGPPVELVKVRGA